MQILKTMVLCIISTSIFAQSFEGDSTIVCPQNLTITCDMDYNDLDITGSASAFGIYGDLEVEYNDTVINLSTCNEGSVSRTWNIIGRSDIFCNQTITMEDLNVPVTVSFSQIEDFTTADCPDMIAIGEPTWVAGPCDELTYTTETDTSYFQDGACLNIVNQYAVINWCDYNPTDPMWNGEGIWEHTQVVKVLEETNPILAECDDTIYAVNDHDDSDNDGEVCETMITLSNIATDPGSENCPTDWLKWQVTVDLWGDGTNDLEYSSLLPSSDDDYDDTNGNGIPDIYLKPTISGEEVNIQLPDIVGALSHHEVTWKVTDGCNNLKICSFDFLISDQTAPTAVCQDTVTVGLYQLGPSRLWAKDYISDVMDNCSSSQDLRYTFSAIPPEDDPYYDLDLNSSSYVLGFNDISNTMVQLPIYSWDENGNFTFCETVFVIDPSIILNSEEAAGIHINALYQNHPNPFRLNTSISFDLDRATPVKLTFINATSSKISELEIAGKEGLNTYVLDRELLSGKGVYYYMMTAQDYIKTKKMMLMD